MPTAPIQSLLSNEDWEKKIYAYMAHRTESGDRSDAIYRLSHAGTPKSGYSFGRVQVDLAGMEAQRKELLQSVFAWLIIERRNPDAEWVENVRKQLEVKGDRNALSKKYERDINDYMATAAGHNLVDRLSDRAEADMLKDRKKLIFNSPAAIQILQDPQSLAYIYKTINAGTPKKLRDFLSGKAVTFSTQPFTVPGGQSFDVAAMQGALEGTVKSDGAVQFDGDRMDPKNSASLKSGTRIVVRKDGFFVKTPNRRFDVTEAPLALDLIYNEKQRLKFKVGNQAHRLIKAAIGAIHGRQITLNAAEFDLTTETQLSPQQASGETPISPQEFYQKYAKLNTYSKPYKDAVQAIYFDDAAFFANPDEMPDMSQPVDWSIWYPLDPKNYLPFNVKTAIVEEWTKDARHQDNRPLNLTIIDEYLKTNRRIQGEMLRAVAPNEGANLSEKDWPGQASTHQMRYLGPDGKERRIAYRVNNAVVANGKRVLAEASRTPEGLAALDIAVGFGRFPSETSSPQVTVTPSPIQKLESKQPGVHQVKPKPPAVRLKKSKFDGLQQQPLPQPINFGGPEPLRRPVGPSPAERAQIEADERMSAALAVFDQEQSLRSLIAAEVEQQLKPPPGRSRFEEAVLCGYNIYSYA